jgi:hypothetical protein
VINSRESGFSRILKSEGGYWVPETLVEQSKMQNEHGSGTHIGPCGEVAIPPPIRLEIGSQQWIRYKPFTASENVNGNMDLAMESSMFDFAADY